MLGQFRSVEIQARAAEKAPPLEKNDAPNGSAKKDSENHIDLSHIRDAPETAEKVEKPKVLEPFRLGIDDEEQDAEDANAKKKKKRASQ